MNFDLNQFIISGDTVHYPVDGERKFVARFKYLTGEKRAFIAFLIKHFTVEEYFARRAAGESPQPILESKGYIPDHIQRLLLAAHFPLTREGYTAYIQKCVDDTRARLMGKAS